MPYSPPASPIDTTWVGANAYGGVGPTITAAWGTTQYLNTSGSSSQVVGTLSAALQYLRIAPAGLDTTVFGGAYVLPPYGYKPPVSSVNASWVGAPVYAGALPPAAVSWSPTIKLVSPAGLAPPGFGSTTIFQQQFISPAGLAPAGVGANAYVLHYWQYLPPTSPLNATWVGKGIYAAPSSPLNVAFVPPLVGGSIAPIGISSAAFGTPAARNYNTLVTAAGDIAPGVAGTPTVYNFRQYVAPTGLLSQAFGSTNVAYRFPNQNVTGAGGINQTALGVPNVSPRFLFAQGFASDTFGIPAAQLYTREVRPSGFSTYAAGATQLELKNRALLPPGLDSQAFGAQSVVNKARLISDATAGTGGYGRPTVWFRIRTVLAQGAPLGAFGTQLISHRNRTVSVFGWSGLKHGLQAVIDPTPPPPAVQRLFPTGIEPLLFGTPTFRPWTVRPPGINAGNFGALSLRDNTIRPESFFINDLARFGNATIPGTQFIQQTDGFEGGLIPLPRLSPYTLRISEDQYGSEVNPIYRFPSTSTPSSPTVTHRIRNVYPSSIDPLDPLRPAQVSAPRVTPRIQTVAPYGFESMTEQNTINVIGGNLEIRPFWGRDVEIDLPELNYDTAAYGMPGVRNYRPFINSTGFDSSAFGAQHVDLFNRTIYPVGLYSARMPEGTRVHPPFRPAPIGWNSQAIGTPWVSARVRSVAPAGILPPAFYPAAEALIYVRNNPKPAGFNTLVFGLATVFNSQNGTTAGLGDTSAFGRAKVGACAC